MYAVRAKDPAKQAQDRVGAVEAPKQQPLGGDAEQPDQQRRGDRCADEAEPVGKDDDQVRADRIEAAVREVDDAAEGEDQRQAERDQQVIGTGEEAVEDLLEDENELHADPRADRCPSVWLPLSVPSFGGAIDSRSSFGPGTVPSAS